MKIQYLNGGLGNQLFQYIFGRYYDLLNPFGDKIYFDDSYFFWEKGNATYGASYELEKVFGIKANLLSSYFEKDVWEEFIKRKEKGVSVPQTLLEFGVPIEIVAETSNVYCF